MQVQCGSVVQCIFVCISYCLLLSALFTVGSLAVVYKNYFESIRPVWARETFRQEHSDAASYVVTLVCTIVVSFLSAGMILSLGASAAALFLASESSSEAKKAAAKVQAPPYGRFAPGTAYKPLMDSSAMEQKYFFGQDDRGHSSARRDHHRHGRRHDDEERSSSAKESSGSESGSGRGRSHRDGEHKRRKGRSRHKKGTHGAGRKGTSSHKRASSRGGARESRRKHGRTKKARSTTSSGAGSEDESRHRTSLCKDPNCSRRQKSWCIPS